jgi:hypothetical protein
MHWRLAWKIGKGLGKIVLAGVLIVPLLTFVIGSVIGRFWVRPR